MPQMHDTKEKSGLELHTDICSRNRAGQKLIKLTKTEKTTQAASETDKSDRQIEDKRL